MQKVQDWLSEIHRIGKAGGCSSKTINAQAAMKLVPQSPAYNWLKVVEQSNDAPLIAKLGKWETFEILMKKEFGAPTDFGTLVSLLQSFKQEPNELVRDFYNRLVLGYNEFNQSLPDAFSGAPWDTEDDAEVDARLAELGIQSSTVGAVETKKKGNAGPPKKDRPMENVVCYYDGSPGHLASKCQKRS